jgi:hypothetical protein
MRLRGVKELGLLARGIGTATRSKRIPSAPGFFQQMDTFDLTSQTNDPDTNEL